MNTLLSLKRISFLLVVSLILTNCTSPTSVELVDATAEFDALNKAFGEDYNNGNAEAVANRYTEDAKLLPPNSSITFKKRFDPFRCV